MFGALFQNLTTQRNMICDGMPPARQTDSPPTQTHHVGAALYSLNDGVWQQHANSQLLIVEYMYV